MANHHDPGLLELMVSETSPQGTQETGVEYGHEMRDIHVESILRWFAGLLIGMLLVIVFLVGLFGFFNHDLDGTENFPSPRFAVGVIPPKPRIEGFMHDQKDGRDQSYGLLDDIASSDGKYHPAEARDGTNEELAEARAKELATLAKFGLPNQTKGVDDPDDSDDYNRSLTITPAMVASVAGEGPKTAPSGFRFNQGGYSEASGGLQPTPHRYVN